MLMPENKLDQAAGLRRIARPRPVRVIAVASGKGGVGKTNVSVNLALALAQNGKEVMLLDADLGLGNVDVLLGLHTRLNLSHVVNGECTLEEVVATGPGGLKVVPAASGLKNMTELGAMGHAGLIRAFSELARDLDVLVIDTAAGISDSVVSFSSAAQEVVVVVCDEPASITDAYALIKLMNREHGIARFRILASMAKNEREGAGLHAKLTRVTDRFLEVNLDFMGCVPYDDYLRKSVQKQRAVVEAYPNSPSARAFTHMAHKAGQWPLPESARGHLEFFVERLIQSAAPRECYAT